MDARELGKFISLIEDGTYVADATHISHAHVIGITGPPGVGKSTTTSQLIRIFRARGQRVAVLAVDPSSPVSGGALLGDRIRMQEHALDEGVFIRSMSARGQLGGLARATFEAAQFLGSHGYDVVLIETVGVGQSEVEVVNVANTVVLVMSPGAGDSIQAAKAGILEVADVYVVNKSDRDGADIVLRELRNMVAMGQREDGEWTPIVVRASAALSEGIDEVVVALDRHREWTLAHGIDKAQALAAKLNSAREQVKQIVDRAVKGELTADQAADLIAKALGR